MQSSASQLAQSINLNTTEIRPSEAHSLMESDDAVVVDVRMKEEIEAFGAIPNSIWIPLGVLQSLAGETIDQAYKEELDAFSQKEIALFNASLIDAALRQKALLVLCRSGNRSMKAIQMLRSLGYFMCYSVSGGLMEWEAAGLPIQYLS